MRSQMGYNIGCVIVLILATTACRALQDGEHGTVSGWPIGNGHDSQLLQLLQDTEMEKRAPSNMNFFGVRGKKAPNNANFFGVRGKKENNEIVDEMWSDELDALEKRAPAAGFFGMRGKKRPAGFFGMRGKKGPSPNNFFGMRGKKSDESTEDLDTLLRALLLRGRPDWYAGGDAEVVGPTYEEPASFEGGQMQKKAPSGFVGMRGKKDVAWQSNTSNSNADAQLPASK